MSDFTGFTTIKNLKTGDNQGEPVYTELTGDDIPYHLLDEAEPLGRCLKCAREIWGESELDKPDTMTQPNGQPCGGTIEKLVHRSGMEGGPL